MKLAALVGIIGQLGVYSNATVGGVNLDIICVSKAFKFVDFFFSFGGTLVQSGLSPGGEALRVTVTLWTSRSTFDWSSVGLLTKCESTVLVGA